METLYSKRHIIVLKILEDVGITLLVFYINKEHITKSATLLYHESRCYNKSQDNLLSNYVLKDNTC